MTTTFENAKVGDRVYALTRGWTEIESIDDRMAGFPIRTSGQYTYSLDGRYLVGGDQVLFWDKPTIIAPEQPKPKREAPPVDTLVEVLNQTTKKWIKRYSSGKLDTFGGILCWDSGATSKTAYNATSGWQQWRIAEDNEGWIEWNGGECPVPDRTIIVAKFRDSARKDGKSEGEKYRWFHSAAGSLGSGNDIIAYKVVT
jgi:hypothetical protein